MGITIFTTAVLIFLNAYMALKIIGYRRSEKLSYGVDENRQFIAMTSAQQNLITYAPLFLILLGAVESTECVYSVFLMLLALAFLAGRFFHFYSMFYREVEHKDFSKRVLGMKLTLFPSIALAVLSILSLIF